MSRSATSWVGAVAVLGFTLVVAGVTEERIATARAARAHPAMDLSPSCVRSRLRAGGLDVVLKNVIADRSYRFMAESLGDSSTPQAHALGRHRAGRHGVVFFTYPRSRERWRPGYWQINALRRIGSGRLKEVAWARLQVRHRHC